MRRAPRILVAPLDWGLGHATRSLPVIRALEARGVSVWLGGAGASRQLLEAQCPGLPSLSLPAYDVRYGRGRDQTWPILRQAPQVQRAIAAEHRQLDAYIDRYQLDGIISDHRYGLWSPRRPAALICHQLQLRSPLPGQVGARLVYRLHRRYLRRFGTLWIPDWPSPDNLGGSLSHPGGLWPGVTYVGPLSRLAGGPPAGDYRWPALRGQRPAVVALLSGPEPQRSLLEARLRAQAGKLPGPFWLVQGQPGRAEVRQTATHWEIPYLDGDDLARALTQARVVISRPGYSSLMDYAALGLRQLIVVPTPGQTEQEYLGRRMAAAGQAYCCAQHRLDLVQAWEAVQSCSGFPPPVSGPSLLEPALDAWLRNLG